MKCFLLGFLLLVAFVAAEMPYIADCPKWECPKNGRSLCFVEENNCPEGYKCCPLTDVIHPPNKAHKGCCAKYKGFIEKPKH